MITWMRDAAVIVARGELTAALQERFSFDRGVAVFSTADASTALVTILQKRLPIVALDRRFVTSPNGARFVSDLRAAHPQVVARGDLYPLFRILRIGPFERDCFR